MDYFKWQKISLMGHSLGGICSFLFAVIYEQKIDLLICLDTFKPYSWYLNGEEVNFVVESMTTYYKYDQRIKKESQPPSYRYEEIVDIYQTREQIDSSMSIKREYLSHIITRAICPSTNNPNRFYFTRDGRLKGIQPYIYSQDACIEMAKRIRRIPFCLTRGNGNFYMDSNEYLNAAIDSLRGNPLFEFHSINDSHFVHLNNPEMVSKLITTFLLKYHQTQTMSKL